MNFGELIPLMAAVTNLALTLFVLTRDLRSNLNRAYLLWAISIVVWNTGTFFMFRVESPEAAELWGRFLHFGVVFLPISLFHLCLLDIHVTLGKAAAQVMRFTFLFLIGLLLLLLIDVFWKNRFDAFTFTSSLVVLLVSALVASIFFPRLFGQGGEALEHRLLSKRFGDRFEYHDRIRTFIQEMPSYSNAELLLQDLHGLLVKTVRLKSYQIILLDESTHVFALSRSHPEQPEMQMPELRADSAVFRLFQTTGDRYLAFNMAYIMPGETDLEGEARAMLGRFRPEFCFSFFSGEEPFGLLLTGEKVNEVPYTPNDLIMLTQLAASLSLILNQIRLKKQVLLAEELELLGRMSRGMAHDLNNLLTPVSTYFQIASDIGPGNSTQELVPVCLRNIGTIQAYVKDALFFSQNHTLQIQAGNLAQLVHQVAELAESKLRRRQVRVDIPECPHLLVEMDGFLIQRLLGNVLSNAIDASPPGSIVRMESQLLTATDARTDWARIRVIDRGEGISRDNLQRISSAYFTTKDSGDEDRGFGLGLAICRRIAHIHGGHINIASEEKKGTTVTIDLPMRHLPAPEPSSKPALS